MLFYPEYIKQVIFCPYLTNLKCRIRIGIYNGQKLDISKTKEFVEYLWSCGSLGIFSSGVIESRINEV